METLNFKDCSRLILERKFGLVQVETHLLLNKWIEMSQDYMIDDIETSIMIKQQKQLIYRVDDWNEQELIEHFIAPMFSIINFNAEKYGMFSFRPMSCQIGDYMLTGKPDAVIAKGRREPEIPYFCFHEYKKELENAGDPVGQCLAAMLTAQALNDNNKPIYGVVVKGKYWEFVVLQGKEYAISNSYKSTDNELFEIVKLLKHLKTIIEEYVKS